MDDVISVVLGLDIYMVEMNGPVKRYVNQMLSDTGRGTFLCGNMFGL